jgi:adenylate cyclase
LEGANKFFGSKIMASEGTHREARDAVEARELGRIRPVGEERPIRVFEFLAMKGGLSEGWIAGLSSYELGLASFNARDYAQAAASFVAALESIPNDGPSARYLRSATDYIAVPPPEDWDGVFDLTTK